ncbi:MAG TPA: hypothetical protein VMJ66_06030 [Geobacteraceae bacterium]|nr:hypothetical protein [Geobacteraceae bacterium]
MTVRLLIAGGVMLTMMAGCSKSKESAEDSFKESFRRSFVNSCADSAMKGGLKEDDAKGKCECAANYLVSRYSAAELSKITAADSPERKKLIEEAVKSCKSM